VSSATTNFTLTTAGIGAAFSLGSVDLNVNYIQLGSGNRAPTGAETALATPKEYALISEFFPVGANQHRLGAMIPGSGINYNVSEIGLWSGVPGGSGSVLVFYWSQATGYIAVKSTGVNFNYEVDLYFGGTVPSNITIVADTSFNALSMLAAHNVDPDAHSNILRTRLTGPLTLNVSNSGNDVTGDGSSAHPFATIQHAWNLLHNFYDLNGYTATIQLIGSTNFTAGLAALGQIPGQYGPSSIVLDGGGLTLTTTNATAIYAGYGAGLSLQNIRLGTVTGGDCIGANFGGQVFLGTGVTFGSCIRAHMDCWSGGSVLVGQNYTINGGATWHMLTDGSGFISTATSNIAPMATLSGTPSFSGTGSAFLCSQNSGIIELGQMTFSGAATGQKMIVQYNGILTSNYGLITSTGGINSTAIPGNSAGVQQYGGQIY